MSNTKQQIEEILPCVSCGINADVADGFGVCTCGNEAKREAIDRLVTDARITQLSELLVFRGNAPQRRLKKDAVSIAYNRIAELKSQLNDKETM